MDKLDLDIHNYSLQDIYTLFQIDSTLNDVTMKKAKKIVLKMHPDKSGLETKYFLFFSKAYKKLFDVYQFQNKSENKTLVNRKDLNDKEKEIILQKFLKQNKLDDAKAFNVWFNEEFEKSHQSNADNGYAEWLKSDEGIIEDTIQGNNVNEKIMNYKKQSIVQYNGIVNGIEGEMSCGSLLGGVDNFSSPLFSHGLMYNDLKDAHQNSVIGVSEDVQRQQFNSLYDYEQFRNKQDIKPLSETQALRFLQEQDALQNEESAQVAYKLTKEYEENKKRNELRWGKMQQIRDR